MYEESIKFLDGLETFLKGVKKQRISKETIIESLETNAVDFMDAMEHYPTVKSMVRQSKAEVEHIYASKYIRLKSSLEKPTEKLVESNVYVDEEYKAAYDYHLKCKYIEDLFSVVQEHFRLRSDNLKELSKSHNYQLNSIVS